MAYLNDRVFDSGLTVLDTESDKITITSQIAGTYAEANATYALGNTTTVTVGAPADRSAGGREVTVSAVTDGAVTGTGTATHYAVLDVTATRLLAAGSLTASQVVTSGNTFTLASFKVGIPDPA